MKRQLDTSLAVGVAALLLVTASNSLLAFRGISALYQSSGRVNRAQHAMRSLGDLLSTIKDAETGQRGFVITGNEEYLLPYLAAQGTLNAQMRDLDSLARGSAAEQVDLDRLHRRVDEKLDELRETIRLRQNEGFAAAERVVNNGRGRATMDSIRAIVGDMMIRDSVILMQREQENLQARNAAGIGIAVAATLELVTLILVGLLVMRQARIRERHSALLHAQREQFSVTLASIADGVITTDADGRVTFMNPVAQSLTGWSSDEAEGQPLETVFPIVREDNREVAANPAIRALREGTAFQLANHTLLLTRQGAEIPVDDSAAPIRNSAGTIQGAVLVFRDITQRRSAENELREADRRKDEFLAVLAHELRSPLAPLRNALEIMRLSGNDRAAIERVGGIMERQLQQMVRLIDDLLDVSRISRNRLALHREPIDVATAVHAALETCAPLLRDSQHALKLTLPPQPVYVNADLARLAQAIANLLSNAIKYTEPGGRIWITVQREDDEVIISVRDSGAGLPADMLDRIFEMFTQVEHTLDRSQGGLGIGLPLVRHIVEMHDGTVTAASPGPGRGSEFVIRLPVELMPVTLRRNPEAAPAGMTPRRILVADDNADSAESLAMMLRVIGHEVSVAHDGASAISEAAQFQPEVALLDIGMPRVNGYDVARAIRQSPGGDRVTLVALTGWGQDEDRRRSREAGFDHHLVKPVDLPELEVILNGERV